jgi:hypothetical protein
MILWPFIPIRPSLAHLDLILFFLFLLLFLFPLFLPLLSPRLIYAEPYVRAFALVRTPHPAFRACAKSRRRSAVFSRFLRVSGVVPGR